MVNIKAHFNRRYTNAEEGSVARTCYYAIWRALRKYHDPRPAMSDMQFRQSLAPEEDKPYYQEALDLLTGKNQDLDASKIR